MEVKTSKNFAGAKSYAQLAGYLDKLGLSEGWMAIFDEDCEVSLLFKHLVDDAGPNLPAPFHLDLVRRELG